MKRTIVSPEAGMRKKGDKPREDTFLKEKDEIDPKAHQAKIANTDLRNGLKGNYATMAERVAQSTIYLLNQKIPDAEKHYPIDIMSRFVNKYFPYAKGGPLWVDEPVNEPQMLKAYEKQRLLQSMGIRSIVILSNAEAFKNMQDAYFDCLEQLGEV